MVSYKNVRCRIGAIWIEQREKDALSVIETSDLIAATAEVVSNLA
jgi:hypothetical protein